MDIVEQIRGFEFDHEPDGWPAVKMKQVSALCDEIERLQGIIDKANAQEPVVYLNVDTELGYTFVDNGFVDDLMDGKHPLYARPINAQQSPAWAVQYQSAVSGMWYSNPNAAGEISRVKINGEIFVCNPESPAVSVPDNWNAQCTCGHRWHAVMPTENCPSCNPSPRITEQDAREIAKSAMSAVGYMHFDEWMVRVCPELLNKLNANAVKTQAAAMPKYLSAIEVLRENIRNPDRGVEYCGIFDNDKTRAAIGTLLSASQKPE